MHFVPVAGKAVQSFDASLWCRRPVADRGVGVAAPRSSLSSFVFVHWRRREFVKLQRDQQLAVSSLRYGRESTDDAALLSSSADRVVEACAGSDTSSIFQGFLFSHILQIILFVFFAGDFVHSIEEK